MIPYIIKSFLCLLVLWGFYKIALEQQTAHTFKRFYLLSSLIIAIALPLITITYSVVAAPQATQESNYIIQQNSVAAAPVENSKDWLALSLWAIYLLGVFVFGFRFLKNIAQIRSKIRQNVHVFAKNAVHILINHNIVPHTFLNYIFLPRDAYDQKRIAPEILLHEQAHVEQKHTLDILFIEVLQIVFWFNPLLFFIKKSVALNHEFIADQKVLSHQTNPEKYVNLILQYAQGAHHTTLTSAINYSLTKKRIVMLSQTLSARKLAIRLAFLIPVLALCIYFFNQDLVAKPMVQGNKNVLNPDSISERQTQDSTKLQYGKLRINVPNFLEKPYVIIVNGKTVPIDNFVKHIDSLTSYWSNGGYYGYEITTLYSTEAPYGNEVFLQKINEAFRKTNFYKKNPRRELNLKLEQKKPTIQIEVEDESVWVFGKSTHVENFAKTIDALTADWTKEDMMNYTIQLQSNNGVNEFMVKLMSEFHKTKLYKTNPSKELIPPPPPPAPMDPSEYNPENYAIAELTLEGDEDIYVKGKKTNLSSLKEIIRKNFPEWVTEDQKPRALTIIKGNNTSDNRIQEVYGTMQDFQINALNVVEEDASGVLISKSQEQEIEKAINLKIYDQKINLDGKDVKLENLTSALNTLTKNWTAVDFEKNGFGLMQYPSTTEAFKNKVEDEIKKSDFYKKTGHIFLPPPPPPPVPQAPPAPTSPPTPDEMIKQMTAVGADFYYNGNKITAEKAKQLFETKNNLNIMSAENKNGENPMVLITDNK